MGTYTYDAFGNCTVNGYNDVLRYNPFRYRGYVYDQDTKLYFLESRYYCPETHRFMNPDHPSYIDAEQLNCLDLYAYCGNDPVNYVDPSGHSIIAMIIAAAIAGAIIGGTINAINAAASGASSTEIVAMFFIGAAIGGLTGAALGGIGGAVSLYGTTTFFMLGALVGAGSEMLNTYAFSKFVLHRDPTMDELWIAGLAGGISGIISVSFGPLLFDAVSANSFLGNLMVNLTFTRPLSYSVLTVEQIYLSYNRSK